MEQVTKKVTMDHRPVSRNMANLMTSIRRTEIMIHPRMVRLLDVNNDH